MKSEFIHNSECKSYIVSKRTIETYLKMKYKNKI